MTTDNGWKGRFEALLAPLTSAHESWFPKAIQRQGALIDIAAAGQTASRLLRRYLPNHNGQIGLDNTGPVPAWAQLDVASQRRLVLRLGAIACAVPIRRSVAKADLDVLRGAIDEATHLEVIAYTGTLIETDLREEYRCALQAKRLRPFLTSIGLSILSSTGVENRAFVSFRLRYLFPTNTWSARRTDLRPDEVLLARLLRSESND